MAAVGSTNISEIPLEDSPVISDAVRDVVFTINFTILCFILSILGGVSNILNMVVFSKMGFQETINISLFALALSDFISSITLLWITILNHPLVTSIDNLPFIPPELSSVTGGGPHICFIFITGSITAFITVERSLCVMVPLKIKLILTPRRVTIVIILCYVINMALMGTHFYLEYLGFKFSPELNRTVLGILLRQGKVAEKVIVVDGIQTAILQFSPMVVVICCTSLLVYKLKKTARWRQDVTGKQDGSEKSKEHKVAGMVTILSAIYILCFMPNLVLGATLPLMRTNLKKFLNVIYVCFSFANVLEAINATLNILVYYKMSSRYRNTFNVVIRKKKKTINEEVAP